MATLGNLYDPRFHSVRKSNVFYDDDPFWSEYDKLPLSYRSQIDPYLNYNYKRTFGDILGDLFGYNSTEDKMLLEMQDRARQQLAALQNDVFQNTFNSQAAQASRQRDAGLNPDLSGEASGDSAAGFEQPMMSLDPSIFDGNIEMPDLIGLFDTAASTLTSYAHFKSLLASAKGNRFAATGTEIKNVQDAYNFAGDYLTAFDPSFRRDDPEADYTPSEFERIAEAKVQAIPTTFSYLSKESQELLTRAVRQRAKDPRIFEQYYNAAKAASVARAEKVVSDDVYSSYDVADDVFRQQSNITYDFLKARLRLMIQSEAILSAYNTQKYTNDFDYETFRTKYNIPQNVAESDLSNYISHKAINGMTALKAQVSKDWIAYLDKLRKSNDPASVYLFNAIVQGGYAPLMGTSLSGGIFGVNGSGSFQSLITPGMSNPMSEISSGMSPANKDPYGWSWIDQK